MKFVPCSKMSNCAYILSLLLVLAAPSITAYADDITIQDAFSPHQGATTLIVRTISEARKSIWVAAYSFTSHPIAEALVDAHNKGIDVQVVMDKSQRRGRSLGGFIAAK